MNCCIQTVQGDITKVDDVEAIVNAPRFPRNMIHNQL